MNNQFNLFGEIVADDSQKWFESDIVPAMVVGWLAKQNGDVEFNINSPGGSLTAGVTIANAIRSYDRGKVTANVLGIAASMASVIACACDEIKMGKGAFLMIHNPYALAEGEAEDLRQQADTLDKMRDSLIAFYQTKTSKTHDEIAALMDAETWIRDDEAAGFGFSVSPIEGEFQVAACATRRALAKAPETARAFFSVREKPAEPPAEPKEPVADWEARYKGASKKLTELQESRKAEIAELEAKNKTALEELEAKNAAALAEVEARHQAEIKDLNCQLDAVRGDLEKAKADLSSAVSRAETAEKDLAEKGEQLERLNNAHALLTGGVLSPGNAVSPEEAYQTALSAAKSPEAREAIRKERARSKK